MPENLHFCQCLKLQLLKCNKNQLSALDLMHISQLRRLASSIDTLATLDLSTCNFEQSVLHWQPSADFCWAYVAGHHGITQQPWSHHSTWHRGAKPWVWPQYHSLMLWGKLHRRAKDSKQLQCLNVRAEPIGLIACTGLFSSSSHHQQQIRRPHEHGCVAIACSVFRMYLDSRYIGCTFLLQQQWIQHFLLIFGSFALKMLHIACIWLSCVCCHSITRINLDDVYFVGFTSLVRLHLLLYQVLQWPKFPQCGLDICCPPYKWWLDAHQTCKSSLLATMRGSSNISIEDSAQLIRLFRVRV